MRELPAFENYMESSSRNYGLNSLRFIDHKGNCFWFSYNTLVAFRSLKSGLVCIQNYWGPTTGKHLNAIERDHKKRVDQDTFDRLYKETFLT